ncbi:MAG: hypothetical protein US53_C0018G0010 [Candidatus Woesebacteria bacterium GW2011_GWA1_37_7]|uniref:Uncharacterized protein n=1 Tax=Candidatus Woesebacteria bacterium GW2011_GWA1_37_7 TaxID=1618545 RepID=A0A0G0H5Q7_9BACT|nr:MAG: hypothetical protein US53_C0018G0010 [Candidatus Woesebacteria bacterium GW2011_GWA1_37_7]
MGIKTVEQESAVAPTPKVESGIRAGITGLIRNLRTDFGGVPKEAWPNPSKQPKLGDIPEHPNI